MDLVERSLGVLPSFFFAPFSLLRQHLSGDRAFHAPAWGTERPVEMQQSLMTAFPQPAKSDSAAYLCCGALCRTTVLGRWQRIPQIHSGRFETWIVDGVTIGHRAWDEDAGNECDCPIVSQCG